jgi:predicted RNA-binding protein YlxR (DUF448 family)
VKEGPLRTCIGCRQVRPKSELLRLTAGEDGHVALDARRTAPGRGVYACPTLECLSKALVGARLARALRSSVKGPRESAAEILESWRRR